MSPAALEEGYWRAYRNFYRWGAIASSKDSWPSRLRHFAYAAGWKKFEPVWDVILRIRRVAAAPPLLERVLLGFDPQKRAKSTIRIPVPPGLRMYPGEGR